MKQPLILRVFIPKGRLHGYIFFIHTDVVLMLLWYMKLSAQGNTTVTKQGLYDNLELKNESNQDRFGALKLAKKKVIVYPSTPRSLGIEYWLHYKTLPEFSLNTAAEITQT